MKRANWWQTDLASATLAFAGFATGASGDDDARYLVVDLSGGPEAESWPVTWMDNMPGSGWTDVYKTTKLVLRRIDVGFFTMGGTRWNPDDQTPHEVFVEHPFYIGVFEVTQKQFELVTGYNPAEYAGDTRPVESVSYDNIRGPNSGSGWPGSRTVDEGSFLGLLRDKTGIEFDLPSEAQWEYACRAGTQTDFNSGQNVVYDEHDPNMAAVGRYYYNKGSSDHHARVGLYAPNAWGLYDMHGNVWEYCLDWYGAYPSSGCVSEFFGPDSGEQRIRRGGSWGNSSLKCISPNRDTALPGTGSFYNGFRLAFTTGKTGYRIRYNANGGTGADSFQYATNGTSVTLAPCTFSRPNHLFAGWGTQQEGPVQYADGKTVQELQPDSDWTASLYAIWEKLQTVTFDANGGSCDTTQCVYSIGKTYCTLPEATRSRYIFAGWWTAASGGSQVTADSTVTSAETRTLYAHWTSTEQVVTFDPNGGKCKTKTKAYTLGGTYGSFPTPTRTHYAFAGWWTFAKGGEQVSTTNTVTGGETRTLYAHWTLAEQVVTFNPNGGTCGTTNRTYTIGENYGWLPEATRADGAAFAGWHALTPNGWGSIAETDVVTVEQSRELWATWGEGGEDVLIHVSGFPRDGETGGFSVKFAGTEGKTYALQRTQKLEGAPSWATVGTLEADRSGTHSMAAETPAGWNKGFYRVVEPGSRAGLPENIYMVFDLSERSGPGATYPVSFLAGEPQDGWTDEYKTTKLVLRRIEAGTFTMGSPTNELGRSDDHETQHEVTISKPLYMGVFEVTQKQWELVMGTPPSWFKASYEKRPVECVTYNNIRGSSAGAGWPGSTEVDATSFLGRLRVWAGGFAFDLPTEAQWEYACRAGTTTALNSGKNLTGTGSYTNMAEVGRYWDNGGQNSSEYGGISTGTAEVGSYKPNAWGLYDMHGNVWEWCLDWWTGGLGSDAATDPVGGASGSFRVRRGGSWVDGDQDCRSAYRAYYAPFNGSYASGFRLVCIPGL